MRFAILISIAAAIIIRIFFIKEIEEALPVTIVVTGIVLLIRNANWLANNILPLGFMSYFAKDFKQSGSSGPALEFLGWIALLAMLFLVFSL